MLASLAGFGKPSGYRVLRTNPDLTSDEQKREIERELHDAKARLERLKIQVDVQGRRS